MTSVYFPTQDVGFVVGEANSIYKTTNAGADWVDISINNSYTLESVFFKDSNTGFAAGNDYDGSMIMKTTDGGNTWDYVWTNNDNSNGYYLKSIRFINDNIGYVSAGHGHNVGVLKTTDGGLTWFFLGVLGYSALGDAFFTDDNTVHYVGQDGSYLKSTDGGFYWTSLSSGTSQYLSKIFFVDGNNGYAVGGAGSIIKLTSGSGLGIEEANLQLSDFELSPNPAEDVFTITNKGKIIKDIKISIFNMSGQQLLLDQFQHQININIANFNKGLYLVKIQSNDFVETKKLVVK